MDNSNRKSPNPILELRPNRHHSDDGWSLKAAAIELGVSYWTARRMFLAENVGRYSTGGNAPVYPATPLKRFQRVRMTYLITPADIERVRGKMRGQRWPKV